MVVCMRESKTERERKAEGGKTSEIMGELRVRNQVQYSIVWSTCSTSIHIFLFVRVVHSRRIDRSSHQRLETMECTRRKDCVLCMCMCLLHQQCKTAEGYGDSH